MNIVDVIIKYNHGIIGTLAVHMILFVWFNINNMSFTVIDPKEKVVAVLDYIDDSPMIELEDNIQDVREHLPLELWLLSCGNGFLKF